MEQENSYPRILVSRLNTDKFNNRNQTAVGVKVAAMIQKPLLTIARHLYRWSGLPSISGGCRQRIDITGGPRDGQFPQNPKDVDYTCEIKQVSYPVQNYYERLLRYSIFYRLVNIDGETLFYVPMKSVSGIGHGDPQSARRDNNNIVRSNLIVGGWVVRPLASKLTTDERRNDQGSGLPVGEWPRCLSYFDDPYGYECKFIAILSKQDDQNDITDQEIVEQDCIAQVKALENLIGNANEEIDQEANAALEEDSTHSDDESITSGEEVGDTAVATNGNGRNESCCVMM